MTRVWRNWAGDQVCAPAVVDRPADEADIVAAVRRAADAGRCVRAVGSGHSFSDIACTDGHMLRLERMNRLLEVDPDRGLVTVEGGITLRELNRELAARGLALEALGDIDAQALAGAVATGTHGTGGRFANLSAQVAALRLVTANGDIVECSEEADRATLLAARVGLGSLGVIASLTLKCVPLFTLHRIDEPRPLRETLARLDHLVEASDHFELYAFPYTDTALTRSTRRTSAPPAPPGRARRYLREVLLENRLIDLVGRAGRLAPAAIPSLNRRVAGVLGRSERIDHSYRVYASRRDVRFTEMEYAVPRAAAAECVQQVMELVDRRRLPVGFPIEVRFVAADDAYLSPSHARDTCYVAVHMFRGMEFESYFRGVEAIMDAKEGRPHWGKRHYQSATTLRRRYPEWDRFQAVRARLDPDGRFTNEHTDRVLGPPERA